MLVMKTKRTVMIILTIGMILSMSGCGGKQVQTGILKDGTYTGTADGFGGELVMEAVIKDGMMQSLQVVKNNESAVLAEEALTQVPKRIKEAQSLQVDGSTGATMTTQAIQAATSDCIAKAGGDLTTWQTDATGKVKDTIKQEKTDTVVIGGGIAGVAAALRLEQLGISVTLFEKMPQVCSSLAYSDGLQIVTGSSLMANGSLQRLQDEVNKIGNNEADADMQALFIDNIPTSIDWEIKDLGIGFDPELVEDEDYSVLSLGRMTDSADSLHKLLSMELDVSGTKVYTDTMAYELMVDDGRIVGVKAKKKDGTVYEVTCDHVIMATGGYGNSQLLLPDRSYCGNIGDTGDMILLGQTQKLSFAHTKQDHNELYWPTVMVNGKYAIPAEDAVKQAVDKGAIIVNREGRRFANEIDHAAMTDAVTDGVSAFLIMDSDMYASFYAAWTKGISKDLKKTVEDSKTGLSARVKGETLAEAAEKAGVNPQELGKTLATYNADCEAGVDRGYGRDAAIMKKIQEEDGYAIVPLEQAVWMTPAGLKADKSLHLTKTDGSVYDNVYVIGEAVGNVFGTTMPTGGSTTWAFVSGKTVADNIAATLIAPTQQP